MRPKVLITGASGLVGGLVIRDLSDKYEFSGLSRRAVLAVEDVAEALSEYGIELRKPPYLTGAVAVAGGAEQQQQQGAALAGRQQQPQLPRRR